MDFLGWLTFQIFEAGGFVLEHWRWFLGGVAAIVFVFVLPEKMRHLSNSITKMIDAGYLLLGRITRYFLSVVVIAVIVYGLYQVGNWRETPKDANEPTAQDLANAEWRADTSKKDP